MAGWWRESSRCVWLGSCHTPTSPRLCSLSDLTYPRLMQHAATRYPGAAFLATHVFMHKYLSEQAATQEGSAMVPARLGCIKLSWTLGHQQSIMPPGQAREGKGQIMRQNTPRHWLCTLFKKITFVFVATNYCQEITLVTSAQFLFSLKGKNSLAY